MASEAHLSHFALKIDGGPSPAALKNDLLDCTVENSLHLPDVCTIRIHDSQFHWLDAQTFREGKKIQVEGGEGKDPLKPLFHGEITAIELDLAAHGVPTLVVRCFDRSHRLHRGRFSRSFVQMTDADIVQKVGSDAGFNVQADSTSQVHDWVFQNNQTNWEFLLERAAHNGFRLFVTGEKDLHFKKVVDQGEGEVKLEWGDDLRSFRPRVTASQQVDEVVVRGWDPKKKQSIVGKAKRATGTPQLGESTDGGQVAQKVYGAAKMVVVDRPVHSQSEAEAIARSLCDEIGGTFVEAEGLCYGQPTLRPGMMVKIDNIGKRFSGKYYVTSTTHSYTPSEGYATVFAVSGKHPYTLLDLIQNDGLGKRARLGGNVVVGIVTNNDDPDKLSRVKVKYPWLTEDHESFWARLSTPMAGPDRGIQFIPEVDDEVLVAFEHGDIRRPYVLGALWNGVDKPVEPSDKAVVSHKVEHRIIKTRIGHTILMDDTDKKGEVRITTCNKHFLTLDDKNENITATTKDGHVVVMDDKNKNITAKTKSGHTILMDDDGDKIVLVDKNGQNKITIKTGDNSIKAECMGDFTVEAQGKVAIHGQQGIEVKTPMQVSIEGTAGVDVKSTAEMNLEATGPATLKSSAILTVQGTLVKIN